MAPALQRLSAVALASLALSMTLKPAPAMAIEEPRYDLLKQDGEFSLRHYPSVVVAETDVDGSLDQASSAGFRRLASYIFGGNHRRPSDPAEKTPTATVASPGPKTHIAMTAPVTTTHPLGTGWTVDFSMPAQYPLASLPLPDDSRVRLREVPELTAAVIRFSGWVDESKIATQTALLRRWMAGKELTAEGDARLARYDPPWTLPFLRRNEIMITCRNSDQRP